MAPFFGEWDNSLHSILAMSLFMLNDSKPLKMDYQNVYAL